MTPPIDTSVPPLARCIELADMVAYGGATWDWNRLHYDTQFAQSKQLPAPVVDGQFFGALLTKMLQDWLGAQWRPAALSMRYRNPVFAGETVRCRGTVIESAPDYISCDLRVVVTDGEGSNIRVAVNSARATLVRRSRQLPSNRAGHLP